MAVIRPARFLSGRGRSCLSMSAGEGRHRNQAGRSRAVSTAAVTALTQKRATRRAWEAV